MSARRFYYVFDFGVDGYGFSGPFPDVPPLRPKPDRIPWGCYPPVAVVELIGGHLEAMEGE